MLLRFYGLCLHAEEYLLQLKEGRLNPRQHVAKIMAMSEVYSPDRVARAIAQPDGLKHVKSIDGKRLTNPTYHFAADFAEVGG